MPVKHTHVVALANRKGGCGKSTSTVNLAAALAHEYQVCVLDDDPQCNTTINFGYDPDALIAEGKKTLADAYIGKVPAREIRLPYGKNFDGRLTVVAGNRGLGAVPDKLEAELRASGAGADISELDTDDIKNEHRTRLRKSVDSLRGVCDFVIIDTPPELRFLTTAALIAADWIVVPVFPSKYDLDGLQVLLRTVTKVRQNFNPNLKLLGVLLGKFNTRAKLDKDVRRTLSASFAENGVFDTVISDSVRHREAAAYDCTIFEHAPEGDGAAQFLSVAREVIERVGMTPNETFAPFPQKEAVNV